MEKVPGINTIVVVLLIPIRVTGHILRRLVMLLLLSAIEHLLEELELGGCACDEQEDCAEKRGEESSHCAGRARSVKWRPR